MSKSSDPATEIGSVIIAFHVVSSRLPSIVRVPAGVPVKLACIDILSSSVIAVINEICSTAMLAAESVGYGGRKFLRPLMEAPYGQKACRPKPEQLLLCKRPRLTAL
jgi:hypothetical protein